VDTGVYEGYTIPPTYDSLVAKLMVWGPSREIALARSVRALEEFVIEGIKTTVPFHLSCIGHPEFKAGNVYTDFIDVNLSEYSV
jgi:acetyl-CoA carboxylase biotin carboxylase subunit